MPNLTLLPRPDGQANYYRFYKNEDTGRHWKVKLESETLTPHDPNASPEVAGSGLRVRLAASPVDAEGHALRDGNNLAIVTAWCSHQFDEWNFNQPDFNFQAAVDGLIDKRIEAGEGLLSAKDELDSLTINW